MCALVHAINQAVAFVKQRSVKMTRAEVIEFRRIADEIYNLAERSELIDILPGVPRSRNNSDNTAVPFESRLHLPGDWFDLDGNGTYWFVPARLPRWFAKMETLRMIAVLQPDDEDSVRQSS
ncbi:MAG: hypothetical protein WC485_00025 [Opitutaceae bacterium]